MSLGTPDKDWKADQGLTTKQLAAALGVQVQSLLVNKAQNGGLYRGLLPKRLRNGHLRWPPDSVARLNRRAAYLREHPRKYMRRPTHKY